jgi:hypothetical protein
MNFHFIFHELRTKKSAPRGRRSRSMLRLEAESLENRTPLSSGLGTAMEPIVVRPASEIGMYFPASPAIELTSLQFRVFDLAVSSVKLEVASATGVLVATESFDPAAANATENDPPSGPVGAVVSPIISSDEVDGVVTFEGSQASSESAAGRASATVPPDAPSGTPGFGAEMHATVDDSTFGPGDDSEIPPFPPLPGFITELLMWRASSPTSADDDDDDSDMSYSGPLEPILEPTGVSEFSTTAPATGRPLSPVFTGRSLQLESYGEYSDPSGLSYLATGQGGAPSFESSADDESLAWDEATDEPLAPGSISTGGLSLAHLLSGSEMSMLSDPDRLAQVAELFPLPESSLALAATLWTVPSDFPTSTLRWHPSAGETTNANARAGAVTSWMLFVTGVDQALEQACREIQDNTPSTPGRHHDNGNSNSQDELLEWQGPILPAAQRGSSETKRTSSHSSRGESDGAAGQGTTPTRQAPRPTSNDSQAIVLGSMPTISVVSVFTLIAGWVWRKRQQRRPVWSREAVSRCRLRG